MQELRRQDKSLHPRWRGYGKLPGNTWKHIQNAAKSRSIPFDISIEYAWELLEDQKLMCKLTGLELTLSGQGQSRGTASLDRIDSSKGYVEGNVQWVHKDINIMKWDHDQDYFIELCRAVAYHADAKERGLAV